MAEGWPGRYALAAWLRLGLSVHRYSMTVAKPADAASRMAGSAAIALSTHP